MTTYRVKGWLSYTARCDCEWCQGHDRPEWKDCVVDAESPEAAMNMVETEYLTDHPGGEWHMPPRVIEEI